MSPGMSRIEIVSVLPTVVVAVLSAVAMVVYFLRLNRSHRRLRATLEEQVAELRATEKALRESEVFYHSLVESLPQSILRKDLQGRFTFCNRNFSNELGRTPAEVLGKDDYAFFPEELAKKYRDDDAAVIEAGYPQILVRIGTDFSELLLAQQALLYSQEMIRGIFIFAGVFVMNLIQI